MDNTSTRLYPLKIIYDDHSHKPGKVREKKWNFFLKIHQLLFKEETPPICYHICLLLYMLCLHPISSSGHCFCATVQAPSLQTHMHTHTHTHTRPCAPFFSCCSSRKWLHLLLIVPGLLEHFKEKLSCHPEHMRVQIKTGFVFFVQIQILVNGC